MSRAWSEQQQAVFDFFLNGKGHGIVKALAGSGKTTTIVEAINRVDDSARILVCAFNKSIQKELESRLRPGVDCKTLHAVGYAAIRKAWGSVRPDDRRALAMVREVTPVDIDPSIHYDLKKLISVAMNVMAYTDEELANLMYEFDCAPAVDVGIERYLSWAKKALELALVKSPEISFDQMVYLPAFNNWNTGNYDFVVVDEVQDMNLPQLILSQNALGENGRFIAVGDPQQAIYGFRGANVQGMDHIAEAMDARIMSLSMTYRCAKEVVRKANELVPELEHAPDAPDGSVEHVSESKFVKNVAPGDYVLSRKNAPLAKYCMKMLAEGRRAYIQGKDVGAGLTSLVKKSKKKTIDAFLVWLTTWRQREVARYTATDRQEQADAVNDKAEVLVTLSEGLETVNELIERVDVLFSEDPAAFTKGTVSSRIMFSSVHKAKGLEADRVWLLFNTFRLGKSEEEDNLGYVAYTRAKRQLFLVDAPKKND